MVGMLMRMSEIDNATDQYVRGREAISYMRLAFLGLMISFTAQVLFFMAMWRRDNRWWIYLTSSILAFIIGDWYHTQAKRIYPEGFQREKRR